MSFNNPILPGWNSDPSCSFVSEWNNTFFCVTSSFMVFPGLPLYASKDLIHWKLVCNIVNRRNQVPQIGVDRAQDNGLFAPTIRYHKKKFYVIVEYVTIGDPHTGFGLVFSSQDPFDAQAWGDPVVFQQPEQILDPDLFWDDDDQLYVQAGSFRQEIVQFSLDLQTGVAGPEEVIWKGTGGIAPEGPHIYKKGRWYYLLIAEGGTDLPHCVTIARSRSPKGPFVGSKSNPILTNRNSDQYFQTVGHADLFEDGCGNWWGVALATRSGPSYTNYPMGRETVLFPVKWDADDWPQLDPVRGTMNGERLPEPDTHFSGFGFVESPEVLSFPPGSALPLHFVHWRFPGLDSVTVSPAGCPNTLRLVSSRQGLSGPRTGNEADGLTLVARRQTATGFKFSVDVDFPSLLHVDEEAGVTVFLTELQYISISLVPKQLTDNTTHPHIKVHGARQESRNKPAEFIALPTATWPSHIKFEILADERHFILTASIADQCTHHISRTLPNSIVSGGSGRWTGSLIGVFATTNGERNGHEVYINRWAYQNLSQATGE